MPNIIECEHSGVPGLCLKWENRINFVPLKTKKGSLSPQKKALRF